MFYCESWGQTKLKGLTNLEKRKTTSKQGHCRIHAEQPEEIGISTSINSYPGVDLEATFQANRRVGSNRIIHITLYRRNSCRGR